MKHYVRTRAADWILCSCISLAMVSAICSGFELTDSFSSSAVLTAVFVLILHAVILLLTYSKPGKLAAGAIGIAIIAAMAVGAQKLKPWLDESANSVFLYFVILLLTVIIVSLLSRTRPGAVVQLCVGVVVIAGAHFLKFPIPVWASFVFIAASAMLMLYRVYMASVLKAQLGQVRVFAYLKQAVIVCLAVLLLATGAYFGIIRPLNPPTQEIKLITQLKSMEMMQVLGVSNVRTVLDTDMSSQAEPEETEEDRADEDSSQDDESEELTAPPQSGSEDEQKEDTAVPDETETNSNATAVWYKLPVSYLVPILIGCALLLIILAFALRMILRKRWHKQVQALDNSAAAVNYYRFFERRLRKIGLGRIPTRTVREYASEQASLLEPFGDGDADFTRLSIIYDGIIYGDSKVTDDERELFERFYGGFFKNLRRELGTFKYLLQIFRF